ncbi:hypothetical protein K466DRAFT_503539, partial [Polyporus arcularius HHB13444]
MYWQPEELQKGWTSSVYAFYSSDVTIGYEEGCRYHEFKCMGKSCKLKKPIRRFLDKDDVSSTGNLRKHAKKCWGEEAVALADQAEHAEEVRRTIVKGILRDGTITMHFARKKGQVTYSHRPHTKAETRTEIARWCCEVLRPWAIVRDRGFQCVMKTGRPNHYIPSPSTVSRDAKGLFGVARNRIAEMLREYEGKLSFATDAWTSPNHRAFVAVMVHLEVKGEPLCLLLDLVEVPEVRTKSM